MAETVGEFIIKRLSEWGVKRIYGYPGDGINGILGGLQKQQDKVRFIQTRHEEMAAFMACAHAKFTGEVGVCLATSGPGAIHLLNGLYDAKGDHQPVVAIVGQSPRSAIGSNFQQEVDLHSLFKDVASEYVYEASDPKQVRHLIDRAMRIAQAERCVTCVIVPKDLQEMDAVETTPEKHGATHSGIGFSVPVITPSAADLQRAANVLNEGEKVAILVGAGAAKASAEIIQVAELLGAGVAKALLGKAVIPDDLPFVTGSIGLLGTKASWDMMKGCDTLLMVGSTFPYSEFLPKENQARGVQIDIDGRSLSLRYPMEVNLTGDSGETLRALIPLLKHKADRAWREEVEKNVADWWKVVEARAMVEANPINPQRVFWELSPRLPDNCILTTDAGTSAIWYARDVKLRQGMMGSVSGSLATMGSGVPYAIAAKFNYPNRVVIALVGDGAMQMNGINELITIAKYWREWSDPRLIVLVQNNRDLNMVSWEMRSMSGNPKFEASQSIPDFQYAAYAEMLGLKGIRVESPELVAGAWEAALSADRPTVIDAVVDPDVPILPPQVTPEQAKAFASAILKGDPDALGVMWQSFQEAVAGVLPGHDKNS